MTGKAVEKSDGGNVPAEAVEEMSGLVRLAIEEKVPVEVLERIVALQERVTDRNARSEFFEALAGFQEDMPEIQKSGTAEIVTRSGGKYKYTFAPLEAITRAIRPRLKEHGLSYAWTTEGMDGAYVNVVCVLRHINGHEERSVFPVSTETTAAMSGAQKGGAALTYGRRQTLVAVLGLTTADDDTDASPGNPEYISESQIADLESLISEVEADRAKFLGLLGVAHIEAITTAALPVAIRLLEGKRK
jgi:hypothetical protein